MYWVIHYSRGVAIISAPTREAAEAWCMARLGSDKAPFAITPASNEDLAEDTWVDIDQLRERNADCETTQASTTGSAQTRH